MEDSEAQNEQLSGEDREAISAEEVFKILSKAWLNERLSPDILPHSMELVELMMGQLAHMESNLGELEIQDIRVMVHKMEISRIRYLVANYLKCRISKIEEFTNFIIEEESKRSEGQKRLSPSELKFATDYRDIVENHLFQVATKHMPINLQQNDIQERTIRPNLMSTVIIQVNSEASVNIVGANDEDITLVPNSMHVVPYQLVASLLEAGTVKLV